MAEDVLLDALTEEASDAALRKAVERVELADYLPLTERDAPSLDRWVPLECGQSMTPPRLTVRLVEALGVAPSHSVLEIGTGSGYATALLAKIARKVTTLERYRTLSRAASRRIATSGSTNVAFLQRDGSVPHRDGILYDRIVVDSAFEQVPRHYIDMLAANGVLVCAVGPLDGEQQLLRLTKIGSRFDRQTLFNVRFGGLEKGVATAL